MPKTFKLERIKWSTRSALPGFEPRVPVPSQSGSSTTAAFYDSLYSRDVFRGILRCVICGGQNALQHCYVFPETEDELWAEFQRIDWIPKNAKSKPRYEPRNGFIGCENCRPRFDDYHFFIRYHKESDKYFLVNWSQKKSLKRLHGKAIALDPEHRSAVLPSLFLAHEERTRGKYLTIRDNNMAPIPLPIQYQDWIVKDQLVDENGRFQQFVPQSEPTSSSSEPQRPQKKRKRSKGDDGGHGGPGGSPGPSDRGGRGSASGVKQSKFGRALKDRARIGA
ncbi:hypothetical protein BT96DRAFT_1027570 [Gymnopus androsaceus JB14]|uniref:HNH nuclease domain-containing protein n=1 Tax=Gymnopus androsaceus JB14 TaxID=1447944 RepID=A0A6A4GAY9_9AGAR|nr:hypothetical protein BT96DRAFT_1027570 [Gymnopus androsaceus JB14]